MKIEKQGRNVLQIHFDDVREGWDQWFLMTSDRHFDSKKSDKGMPPKPKGAVWLRFYYERKHIRTQMIQDVR